MYFTDQEFLDLDVFEFRLLGHMRRRASSGAPAWSGVKEASTVCRMSRDKTIESLTSLAAKGYIQVLSGLSPEKAASLLKEKNPQAMPASTPVSPSKCSWCGGSTVSLEYHHYPIPRKYGGTQTVPICSNCHSEYHALTSPMYRLKGE